MATSDTGMGKLFITCSSFMLVDENNFSSVDVLSFEGNENLDEALALQQQFDTVKPSDNIKAVLSKIDGSSMHMPKYVKILIIGRCGSGKSTLVNTLFGTEVARVGEGGRACQHADLVTKYLLPEKCYDNEKVVQIMIYDTVGLGEKKGKDKAVLEYIKRNVEKVHLLLLCHRLYDKVDHSTEKMLRALAEYCDRDIFNHMIILLTHADTYRVYIKDRQEDIIKRKFEERFDSMKSSLCETIGKLLKVEVRKLPFCLVCDDTELILPHTVNWEYEFWMFILHKCDNEAKIALSYFARVVRKIEIALN